MAKDYVLLKIDVERDLHGEEVATKLRGERTGGIPWIVITDANGTELVASDRPTDKGPSNIGCPVSPEERGWFLSMLQQTQQRMAAEGLATIERELAAFAETIRH
ncbi:MAG: hypothetical protein H6827_04950 [Planctomycetes bacterium]|nr:hypothetical protein [Planctomycetota bacterium]HPF13812.1 hypothetical protein [Planctomycetota bacterium]